MIGQLLVKVGVSGEVDAARAFDQEADSLPRSGKRMAPAVMLGRDSGHRDRTDCNAIAHRDLLDLPEPLAGKQPPHSPSRNDPHVQAEPTQGRQVEMVEVLVGKQHRVRLGRLRFWHLPP